jgi:hypothetical protein
MASLLGPSAQTVTVGLVLYSSVVSLSSGWARHGQQDRVGRHPSFSEALGKPTQEMHDAVVRAASFGSAGRTPMTSVIITDLG